MAHFYVIRKRGTDLFLPTLNKHRLQSGGYTHTTPTSMADSVPRLFRDRHSANIALTYWLKGPGSVKWETRNDMDPVWGSYEESGLEFKLDPSRIRTEYEVIAIDLIVRWEHNGDDEE